MRSSVRRRFHQTGRAWSGGAGIVITRSGFGWSGEFRPTGFGSRWRSVRRIVVLPSRKRCGRFLKDADEIFGVFDDRVPHIGVAPERLDDHLVRSIVRRRTWLQKKKHKQTNQNQIKNESIRQLSIQFNKSINHWAVQFSSLEQGTTLATKTNR